MIRKPLLIFAGLIVLLSANFCRAPIKEITREKKGDYIIEAHFIDNGKIDGLAKYFDLKENLVSEVWYENGIKMGTAINYHVNGAQKDSMNYSNGLINGKVFSYDTLGRLFKITTYYYGVMVGSNFFYSSDRLEEYSFDDFNSNRIFSSKYDSSGKCLIGSTTLKPITELIGDDSDKTVMRVFLYLPEPPNLVATYKLGLINEKNAKKDERQIAGGRIFLDTILNKPEKGYNYYLSAHMENIKDSINRVFVYNLAW